MRWRSMPQRPLQRVLIFWAAVLLAGGTAAASDYCVTCQQPETSYRCVTNDGREGPGKDQREALHCITEIARRQGHGSCGIENTAAGTCLGQPIAVDVSGVGTLAKPETPVAPADGRVPAAPAPGLEPEPSRQTDVEPAAPGDPDEPSVAAPIEDTAQEPADEPAEQPTLLEKSQQNMEKAGKAIGNAAKKSWNCMSSLFNDC